MREARELGRGGEGQSRLEQPAQELERGAEDGGARVGERAAEHERHRLQRGAALREEGGRAQQVAQLLERRLAQAGLTREEVQREALAEDLGIGLG